VLVIASVLAVLSVLLLLAGPLGARFGAWPFGVGFALLAAAVLTALAAIALGVLGGARTHRWGVAIAIVVVAAGALLVPLLLLLPGFGKPPIHDITTDPDDPPLFEALLPLRPDGVSPAAYDGPAAAAQQRRAYPDVQPLIVNAPASRAFEQAVEVARDGGWEVIAADREAGRIEAVATTPWFGFKDDVVIRVRPQGAAARVDMRSKSRVGVGDLGANARRIQLFVSTLQNRMH
jgi:uncharacterized protein (DUF1499 family)